jgi:sortase B
MNNFFQKTAKSVGSFSKSDKPYLVIAIACVLVALLLLSSITYWWLSTHRTSKLIDTIQYQEVVGVDDQVAVDKPKEFPFVQVDFTAMKKRNDETVAWLKMDSVNLSIPIAQTTNNEYYLDHDIDKNSSKLGWVFADVRSNMEHLGTNTVLYGHNAASKQMFGSLKEIFNSDPEKVAQDEIIQLTTPYKQMVFQIASVYVTEYDDWKYVDQVFTGDTDKQEFINRMREKNELKIFDRTDLSVMDKFLTFSTCYGPAGTTKRLVVHARLLAEKVQ